MFGLVLAAVMLIVLLFSMAGIYTLMAFTVAQRWREIGLRSALGAQPRRLVAGIFGRALVPVVAGAVAGSLVALLIDSNVQITQVGGRSIPGILPASRGAHDCGRPSRVDRTGPSRPSGRPSRGAARRLAVAGSRLRATGFGTKA